MLKTTPLVALPQVLCSLFYSENLEEVLLPAAPATARFQQVKPPGTTPSCGGAPRILGWVPLRRPYCSTACCLAGRLEQVAQAAAWASKNKILLRFPL